MDSIQRYKTLAVTAHRSGDFNAFKEYAQIILRIAKANDLQEEQISALVYLAIYHQQIDEYEKSLTRYLEAEKLSNSLPENSFSRINSVLNVKKEKGKFVSQSYLCGATQKTPFSDAKYNFVFSNNQ